MKAGELHTDEYTFGADWPCDCGGHATQTVMRSGDGVAAIASLLPGGGMAGVVAERDETLRDYARRLRKAGIGTRRIPLTEPLAEKPDDDVRLLVALGGNRAAAYAKRMARRDGLPVFVVITSPCAVRVLDPVCLDFADASVCDGTVPVGAAVAEDLVTACGNELPSAFGDICATALRLFDREAYGSAVGKSYCGAVRERALDITYRALDAVTERRRDDPRLCIRLADLAVKSACLSQAEASFTFGSADDCARAAARLFRFEARPPLSHGEFAFLFGAVLSKMYCAFLEAPSFDFPPPDNNLRADRLTELFGLSEHAAVCAAVRRLKNAELAAYRIQEYRDELYDAAAETVRVFEEAKRRFRRLYADDGFGLRGVLEASDVRLVTALAPDLFPANGSMLTLLREFGVLDRYL